MNHRTQTWSPFHEPIFSRTTKMNFEDLKLGELRIFFGAQVTRPTKSIINNAAHKQGNFDDNWPCPRQIKAERRRVRVNDSPSIIVKCVVR